MKKILLLISVLLLNACASVAPHENVDILKKEHKIEKYKSFYVLYPENGDEYTYIKQEHTKNEQSAEQVVNIFKTKFNGSFGSLYVGKQGLSLEEGFKDAALRGDDYLITLNINIWQDSFYLNCVAPLAQGSNRDKGKDYDIADVNIRIYDVKTKQMIDNQNLYNAGCPVVVLNIPFGKNSPEARFKEVLDNWFRNI